MKNTVTIEDWTFVWVKSNGRREHSLLGNVTGHDSVADGRCALTSKIVKNNAAKNGTVETRNTIYKLKGSPIVDEIEIPDHQRARLKLGGITLDIPKGTRRDSIIKKIKELESVQ